MSAHKQSCTRRIRQELASRDDLYAGLWRCLDAPDATDDVTSAVYDELEPLAVDIRPVIRIQLSWGGPADWLEIELGDDGGRDIRRMTYHLADWFDHAEREVVEHEAPALWRAAQHYAQNVHWNAASLSKGDSDWGRFDD